MSLAFFFLSVLPSFYQSLFQVNVQEGLLVSLIFSASGVDPPDQD